MYLENEDKEKKEMGMRNFLPFLPLIQLHSSFKTPSALASSAFVPTPFLWLSLPSPNPGTLTEFSC